MHAPNTRIINEHCVLVGSLEHLSGKAAGKTTWLGTTTLDVRLADGWGIRVSPATGLKMGPATIARLHIAGDSYEVEAARGHAVWVNGKRVEAARLADGDVVEFGELGPICRYRMHGEQSPARKTFAEIVSDTVDYWRSSRQPRLRRAWRSLDEALRQLTLQTTLLFRFTVIGLLGSSTNSCAPPSMRNGCGSKPWRPDCFGPRKRPFGRAIWRCSGKSSRRAWSPMSNASKRSSGVRWQHDG